MSSKNSKGKGIIYKAKGTLNATTRYLDDDLSFINIS